LFFENQRLRASFLVTVGTTVLLAAGCGTNYRSVVTPIATTGPASQPTAYAAFLSSPSTASNGVLTVVDYSGDTIIDQAILGVGPIGMVNDQTGVNDFSLNTDKTLSGFSVSSSFQTHQVTTGTLVTGSTAANIFSLSTTLYVLDSATNAVDILKGDPASYVQSINLPLGPVTATGVSGGQRLYAVSQMVNPGVCATPASVITPGVVTAIEFTGYTVSATLPVGKCPVYALSSSDSRRAFVLNRTDGTVSVIDTVRNTLDTTHPTIAVGCNSSSYNKPCSAGTSSGPVFAEYYAPSNLLVTANYDDSTISIIDVSLDIYGNDSATFGQTVTIPVGQHPASVTVLYDGSRAYTANQADGTVSIVNMTDHSVAKTLTVNGHPRTIVSIKNSIYGKVYVVSPDSPYATIINTEQDIVSTSLLLQGNAVDVRVSSPNGTGSTSTFLTTRLPGSGQP
jgi:YVTN family beta-propeller protein